MICLAAETTWIGQKMNVIAGAMGEIMINKRDVKQGKVLILYNTIRKVSDHLYYVSV
jgi:hypothetical protein